MRINLAVDLHITRFDAADVIEYDRGLTNAIIQKMDDRMFITQRPSIDVFEIAAGHISDARGRGIYYLEANNGLYIVNNDSIYKNSQGSTAVGEITAGNGRVYFTDLAGVILLIDPENSEGWTITGSDELNDIDDEAFPTNADPAVNLAHGVVSLNGTAYVLTVDGQIYGSDFEDPTGWSSLNFIEAEREPDGGVYIGKQHDTVVVFGPRTIEFFIDAANPQGSPLSRRGDIFYSLGCYSGSSVWQTGDLLFFVGVDASGQVGVYEMSAFVPKKVSNETLDAYLTYTLIEEGYSVIGSGYSARGHTFYKLTVHPQTDGNIRPSLTLSYDATTRIWSVEDTQASAAGQLPVVAWTVRTGLTPRVGEGILTNGDLITVSDNMIPVDTVGGTSWVMPGWVASNWIVSAQGTPRNIPMSARTGQLDGGASLFKYGYKLRLISDRIEDDSPVIVRWVDERTAAFGSSRAVDLSKDRAPSRLGRFRRRNHQIEYSGNSQVRLEALEYNLTVGSL